MTDAELLARYRGERDADAFAELAARHGRMVWAVCRRATARRDDAEDAYQATFLLLAGRPEAVRRPERLAAWLHGVAYRTAARARSRRRHEPLPDVAGRRDDSIDHDLCEALHAAVERLPARLRAAVVLCYLEGHGYREAARLLGCPVGSVCGWLSRARDRLRDVLTARGFAPAGIAALLVEATDAAPRLCFPAPESVTKLAYGGTHMNGWMFTKLAACVLAAAAGVGLFARAQPAPVPPAAAAPVMPTAKGAEFTLRQVDRDGRRATFTVAGTASPRLRLPLAAGVVVTGPRGRPLKLRDLKGRTVRLGMAADGQRVERLTDVTDDTRQWVVEVSVTRGGRTLSNPRLAVGTNGESSRITVPVGELVFLRFDPESKRLIRDVAPAKLALLFRVVTDSRSEPILKVRTVLNSEAGHGSPSPEESYRFRPGRCFSVLRMIGSTGGPLNVDVLITPAARLR